MAAMTCTVFSILSDGHCKMLTNLSGCSHFTLTVSMSGGRGDVAWQHTQLFRQKSDDRSASLKLKIHLKPC